MFLVVSGGHIRMANCGEGSPESRPVSRKRRCTSCRMGPLGCSSPATALCPVGEPSTEIITALYSEIERQLQRKSSSDLQGSGWLPRGRSEARTLHCLPPRMADSSAGLLSRIQGLLSAKVPGVRHQTRCVRGTGSESSVCGAGRGSTFHLNARRSQGLLFSRMHFLNYL